MKFKFETFDLAGDHDAGGRTFTGERDFSDPPETSDIQGRLGLNVNKDRPEAVVLLEGAQYMAVNALASRTAFLNQIDNDDYAAKMVTSVREEGKRVKING